MIAPDCTLTVIGVVLAVIIAVARSATKLGSVWCVVCGVWCVVCGVWCMVCGVWCVVYGVWCVVCGVVCGVWCVVCGVWCVYPGPKRGSRHFGLDFSSVLVHLILDFMGSCDHHICQVAFLCLLVEKSVP